jgi:hypothetical protein
MTGPVVVLEQDALGREGLPQVGVLVEATERGVVGLVLQVGVLYEAMYLAATAMGLAPCGLGGGDAALFARSRSTLTGLLVSEGVRTR